MMKRPSGKRPLLVDNPWEKIEGTVVDSVNKAASAISFKDFFPDLVDKKADSSADGQKKPEEQKKNVGSGRDIEAELRQIREQKRQEEEQEKKYLAVEEEKRKRREDEQAAMEGVDMVSSNPSKQKKKRGGAFAQNKKKSQQGLEYSKKPD